MDQDKSVKAAIRYAVGEHLEHLFPTDRRIEIHYDPGSAATRILMGPAEAPPKGEDEAAG